MRAHLLAAALAAVVAVPSFAHASCHDRRLVGTVAGGVAGGLIGNAVSRGAGGVLVGAGLGAFAGHEIAGSGCHDYRHYRRHAYYRRDRHDSARRPSYVHYASNDAGRCRMAQQGYYDARGNLVYRSVQVCR